MSIRSLIGLKAVSWSACLARETAGRAPRRESDRENLRRRRWLPLLLAGWFACGAVNATTMKVAFLAPDPEGSSPHWDRIVQLMRAAAEDLQIELQVAYSKTNTYSNRKDGLALISGAEKPDYFISGYWSGATASLLAHAERVGVRSFFISSAVVPEDREALGRPREKYRHWLGQMTPDEHRGGYDLAERLVSRAGRNADTVHVIALEGFGDTSADVERSGGMKAYLAEQSGVVLDQTLLAEWSRETARASLAEVLNPGSPVSVIWSAADTMALGAVEAARAAGKTPGKDIFIGGFDWSLEGVKAVSAGDMEVTLGGHFLEGAWALVLLHDYHHGRDFASDLGVEFRTPLEPLTADDAQAYLDIMVDKDWSEVDFRRFSKVHNPGLERYQWPLKQVFAQLRQ